MDTRVGGLQRTNVSSLSAVVFLSTSAFCTHTLRPNISHSIAAAHYNELSRVTSGFNTSLEALQLPHQEWRVPQDHRRAGSNRFIATKRRGRLGCIVRALHTSGVLATRRLFGLIQSVATQAAARARERTHAVSILLRRIPSCWLSLRRRSAARRLRSRARARPAKQRRRSSFRRVHEMLRPMPRRMRDQTPSSQNASASTNGSHSGGALWSPVFSRRQLLRRAAVWATRGLREAFVYLRRRLLLAWRHACVHPLLRIAEPVLRPLRIFRGFQRAKRFCARGLNTLLALLDEWWRCGWRCLATCSLIASMMASALLLLRSVIPWLRYPYRNQYISP